MGMALSMRVLVTLGFLAAAGILIMNTAFAKEHNGDTRPGWGFGDQNHTHTGPPGGPSQHPVK